MTDKLDTELADSLEDFDALSLQPSSILETKANKRAALWLCLACIAFYILIGHGLVSGEGYDAENYYTAKNLIENGKVSVYDPASPVYYSRNGILEPLLMVPWYFVTQLFKGLIPVAFGTEWLVAWFNPLLTTLTVLYIYLFILKLGFGRQAALIGSLLAAFTSMMVPYSQIGMETFQTLAMVMAVYYAYSFKLSGNQLDLLWAGLSAGMLLGAKQISFLLLLPIGLYTLYILYQRWGWRNRHFWSGGIIWLIPVMASLGLIVWFYSVRSNNQSSGLSLIQAVSLYGNAIDFRLIGLYSYIFSLNKSFFLFSPTALLGLFAARSFWHNYRAEALLFVGLIVMALVFPSFTVGYGDDVWGPRYIEVLAPLGYIVGASLFQGNIKWGVWKRRGFIALALFAGFVQFLGSLYWYGRYSGLMRDEGLSSQVNYGEVSQTSQLLVHFQMFVGNVTHILPGSDQYLEYRAYYFPIPNPPPKLVSGDVLPKLDIPKVKITSYAMVEQWVWKVLRLPDLYSDAKIVTVVLSLIFLLLLVLALAKLRKFWRSEPPLAKLE